MGLGFDLGFGCGLPCRDESVKGRQGIRVRVRVKVLVMVRVKVRDILDLTPIRVRVNVRDILDLTPDDAARSGDIQAYGLGKLGNVVLSPMSPAVDPDTGPKGEEFR